MNSIQKYSIIAGIGIATLIGLCAFSPFTVVPTGHVGVVSVFGEVRPESLPEGLHVVNPIAGVHKLNTQVQKAEVKGDAASKDLQSVTTTIALNYHIAGKSAPWFYQNVGADYENRIINPAVEEVLKATAAGYTAEELITKRDEVRSGIRKGLSARLLERSGGALVVDDFAITNFAFSRTFNDAIESKQQAEQLALKAKRDLDRIRIEADQKVAAAQAEAASLKAQKQEITPDLIKLREIEAQREAIKKWNGVLPNVTSGAVPFLNLQSK